MDFRGCIAVAALLGAAGLAVAQSQNKVFTQDNDEPGGAGYGITETAPGVATSSLATIVTANRRIALYNRTTLAVEDFRSYTPLGSPPFPFVRTLHPAHPSFFNTLFEPRATYDPINDRLWMLYTETEGNSSYLAECGPVAKLHLALNRDPSGFPDPSDPLDSLDDDYWHYYTGDGSLPTKSGAVLDLNASGYAPYRNEISLHQPPGQTVRGITMAFHNLPGEPDGLTGAAIVTPNRPQISCDSGSDLPYDRFFPHEQFMYIIPFQHDGGTKSILDGDRPDPGDITIIRLNTTPDPADSLRAADPSDFAYAVQAPYEQVDNASFFISVPDRTTAEHLHKHVRLKGLFYDDSAEAGEEWTLQQSVSGTSAPLDFEDMDLPEELWFVQPIYSQFDQFLPETPDTAGWRPLAGSVAFQSAVLAKDVNGDFRIFAVHAVRDVEVDEEDVIPQDQWVVQWYVIDPDMANFHDTPAPATTWEPSIATYTVQSEEIEAMGRIATSGQAYHPVIVVNRQGLAFIEFTYSDGTSTGWPQIRRVRLNSTYSDVVSTTNILVRGGPELPYVPDANFPAWALFADAQADPINQCAYWSTHTLVHDPGQPLPDDTEERDVWLFHQAYSNSIGPNCFQTTNMLDLNDDNEVDEYDMLEFTPMFDRRARRVDIDGNGVVDATDAMLFTDAYRGYTRR